jgi:hypothetical protein
VDQFNTEIIAHSRRMSDKASKFLTMSYENMPGRLHHYLPGKPVLKSVIENGEMWASHAYDMADKKELWYCAELLQERIKFFKQSLPQTNFAINEFFEMASDVANPYTNSYTGQLDVFILSFTEDGNSLDQWENYANSSSGYCLDFEVDHKLWNKWFVEKNLLFVRVIYDREKHVALIDELIREQLDFIAESAKHPNGLFAAMPASVSAVNVLRYYVMAFKQGDPNGSNYSSENEWRLVYGMRAIANNRLPDPLSICSRDDGDTKKRYVKISLDSMQGFVSFNGVRAGEKVNVSDQRDLAELQNAYFSSRP